MTIAESAISTEKKIKIEKLLARAVTDHLFCIEFTKRAEVYLAEADISPELISLLSNLQRSDFEELGINIRPYRDILREDGYKYAVVREYNPSITDF
jgi:hypothetical protein